MLKLDHFYQVGNRAQIHEIKSFLRHGKTAPARLFQNWAGTEYFTDF